MVVLLQRWFLQPSDAWQSHNRTLLQVDNKQRWHLLNWTFCLMQALGGNLHQELWQSLHSSRFSSWHNGRQVSYFIIPASNSLNFRTTWSRGCELPESADMKWNEKGFECLSAALVVSRQWSPEKMRWNIGEFRTPVLSLSSPACCNSATETQNQLIYQPKSAFSSRKTSFCGRGETALSVLFWTWND